MAQQRTTWAVVLTAAAVVALPFILRDRSGIAEAPTSGPVAVVRIITPHNEAIRYEFGQAFARWHAERYGQPARVEWVVVGGTSETSRYLEAQYTEAVRAWWTATSHIWPVGAEDILLNAKFATRPVPEAPAERARHEALLEVHRAYRATDDPAAFTVKVDLLFGGGAFDHQRAAGEGFLVAPWVAGQIPIDLFADAAGHELIPAKRGGEVWRGDTYFGAVASAFGICVNRDRLRDLGIAKLPESWADLAAPSYFRQLGLADPTKSGSFAKIFEIIIQQQCAEAVRRAGFDEAQVDAFEAQFAQAKGLKPGEVPAGVPAAYQQAVEAGWLEGVRLVQRLGANARYFTDSAGRVPVDVAAGQVVAGLAIDFYARVQEQTVETGGGREVMAFIAPRGAAGVSADPIALLRGAEHRTTAVRFIEFVLGPEGQKLWAYREGAPGGPRRYSLRRLPIRRDFYPSEVPEFQAVHERHRALCADDPADPANDPYALSAQSTYRPRWTGAHFGLHRDLVKAMCLDSSDELQAAWRAILAAGGPDACPEAMAEFTRMPEQPLPLTWANALRISSEFDRLDYLETWTTFFRGQYKKAGALAAKVRPSSAASAAGRAGR